MQKAGVVFKKKTGAFFCELTDRLHIAWPTMQKKHLMFSAK
jgi:hypothetical protein